MTNNELKYSTIVKEEKDILEEIRQNIRNNKEKVADNFSDISGYIDAALESSEKLKLVKQIEVSVSELLDSIVNAESIEELTDLRKALNNQIRKVRKVLSTVEDYDITNNEVIIKETRSNISKLYRNQNRNKNLISIEELIGREDTLDTEEKQLLTKGLRNERSYIKRTKNALTAKVESSIESEETPLVITTGLPAEYTLPRGRQEDMHIELSIPSNPNKRFDKDILNYMHSYGIHLPKEYGKNPLKNIVTFFQNIPTYRRNRKIFKIVAYDYTNFSHYEPIAMIRDYLQDTYTFRGTMERKFMPKCLDTYRDIHKEKYDRNVQYVKEVLSQNKTLVRS